jgi:hypothetical protein
VQIGADDVPYRTVAIRPGTQVGGEFSRFPTPWESHRAVGSHLVGWRIVISYEEERK